MCTYEMEHICRFTATKRVNCIHKGVFQIFSAFSSRLHKKKAVQRPAFFTAMLNASAQSQSCLVDANHFIFRRLARIHCAHASIRLLAANGLSKPLAIGKTTGMKLCGTHDAPTGAHGRALSKE